MILDLDQVIIITIILRFLRRAADSGALAFSRHIKAYRLLRRDASVPMLERGAGYRPCHHFLVKISSDALLPEINDGNRSITVFREKRQEEELQRGSTSNNLVKRLQRLDPHVTRAGTSAALPRAPNAR